MKKTTGKNLCVACGKTFTAQACYCSFCGKLLNAIQPSNQPQITGRLLNPDVAATSEYKQATILFVDLVDSTNFIARLDPEDAMRTLQLSLHIMREAVERFSGTVIRTMGDGMLAMFGTPRAIEGHAFLACQTAIAIRDAFALHPAVPPVIVGLHSGEVIADAPESNPLVEQAVHGMAVHLASRLLAEVGPGEICITMECCLLARTFIQVTPIGPRALRGVPKVVELYKLTGLTSSTARSPAGQYLTSFRGRVSELHALQQALARVSLDGARVIGIVGDAGAGKSRLCLEFAAWCRNRAMPVYEIHPQLYGHATPLKPVLDLLRLLLFDGNQQDDKNLARGQVAAGLRALGPDYGSDDALLCETLGLPMSGGKRLDLPPASRQARLLKLFQAIVLHCGKAPSVIIIEDLHWLDEASEVFISVLVNAVSHTSTLLVLNYRPSYSAAWMQQPGFQPISLSELDDQDTAALARELLGLDPALMQVCTDVCDRSGGNPFFLEELVRSLAESGALLGQPGQYRLGRDTGTVLPATVQSVIGARIDRLQEFDRALLQISSIIGKEVVLPLLQDVVSVPMEHIAERLGYLCDIYLLRRQREVGKPVYSFRHPLIQEVAYAAQLRGRRTGLHARVAQVMERHFAGRLEEFAGLLAHHFELAGDGLCAAQYGARAAAWIGSTSSAQSLKHWHKVRLLLQQQPRGPAPDALRIMASGQLAWHGYREGLAPQEAALFIEEALGWARETDDSIVPLLMFVQARIAGTHGGPADSYIAQIKHAMSLLGSQAHTGRAATLFASLSQAYRWAGLLHEALTAGDEALKQVAKGQTSDNQFLGFNVEHWVLSVRGRILVRLGRFEAAMACFNIVCALDPKSIDPTVQFIAHLGFVDIGWCRGDKVLAAEHAAQITALADLHGSPYLLAFAAAANGIARSTARDYVRAASDFVAALKIVREANVALEFESEMLAGLAEAYLAASDLRLAHDTALMAIGVAQRRSARNAECRARISYGVALVLTGGCARLVDAETEFSRAEALITETGAVVYSPLLTQARMRAQSATVRFPDGCLRPVSAGGA